MLFGLDENASLYLAVSKCRVGGHVLEGVEVAPDIVVENTTHDQAGYDKRQADYDKQQAGPREALEKRLLQEWRKEKRGQK